MSTHALADLLPPPEPRYLWEGLSARLTVEHAVQMTNEIKKILDGENPSDSRHALVALLERVIRWRGIVRDLRDLSARRRLAELFLADFDALLSKLLRTSGAEVCERYKHAMTSAPPVASATLPVAWMRPGSSWLGALVLRLEDFSSVPGCVRNPLDTGICFVDEQTVVKSVEDAFALAIALSGSDPRQLAASWLLLPVSKNTPRSERIEGASFGGAALFGWNALLRGETPDTRTLWIEQLDGVTLQPATKGHKSRARGINDWGVDTFVSGPVGRRGKA